MPFFKRFRRGERLLHFVADALGNLVAGDGDVANPEAVFLDENEVGRARAHVDDQRAIVGLGLAVAKGVEQREGGDIDLLDLDPDALHGLDFGLEDFFLDRDDDRLRFIAVRSARRHHLVIPGHFVDRERAHFAAPRT